MSTRLWAAALGNSRERDRRACGGGKEEKGEERKRETREKEKEKEEERELEEKGRTGKKWVLKVPHRLSFR